MPLLKRLQVLAKSLKKQREASAGSDGSVCRRPSSADFSLQKSALSRTIGWHVGRGASSGLLQEIASDLTASPLTKWFMRYLILYHTWSGLRTSMFANHSCSYGSMQGTRWAATLGASGRRAQHIEERLSKAVSSSKSDAAGLNHIMLSKVTYVRNMQRYPS